MYKYLTVFSARHGEITGLSLQAVGKSSSMRNNRNTLLESTVVDLVLAIYLRDPAMFQVAECVAPTGSNCSSRS